MTIMTHYRAFHRLAARRAGLAVLSIVLCVSLLTPALLTSPAYAQDGGADRQLTIGETVTGTLDADNFAQVYTLAANAGDSVSLEVTTTLADLAPVVLLSGPDGNTIAQDADTTTPTVAAVPETTLDASGTYTIIVMRGTGAEGDASGEFTLTVGGVAQITGQTVNLENGGIVFDLTWAEAVNLNLEVRDPVGGAVHAFNLSAPSGGTLDADVNANCAAATANNPTETIAWPAGEVPAGSYEVIIYYVDGCSVGGPQQFTLDVNVNDGTPKTINGTLNPGQRYLARMVLDANGSWTLTNGGVNAGLDVTLFSSEIANAEPIAVGSTVSGTITNAEPAQAYTFDATSGTIVNIAMNAQSGSLDTYLILLGPDQTPLVSNDDNDDSTNSLIERTLAVDGTYTIIATRYALTIGGTEGDYTLALNSEAAQTAATPGATPAGSETGAVLPTGAIEVQLTWLTNADLQLQVRDPSGETVYDDVPEIRSGGILESDGNRNCTDTSTAPVSYIYWPPNRLVPGVYEVEVWYQNNCSDNTPVNFSLSVNVQGQNIINTTQAAALNSRYMITFTVGQDGTATAGPGGFFNMANASTLNYQTQLDTASPITYGGTVSGSITDRQRFQVYSFDGQQGDIVTITMDSTGGTLDPALYLISPDGIQVAYNDDVVPGENPNSAIENAALVSTGTYYIIATHYGLNVGGTEGTYSLTLTQQ